MTMLKLGAWTLIVVFSCAALLLSPLPVRETTRVVDVADIARPPAQVYDYVTTPGNWPRWHPSSLGVHGATDHPLRAGETVVEEFNVAGRRGDVAWLVIEAAPGRRWIITGRIDGRAAGRVTYTLVPAGDGTTRFTREFQYDAPNLLFAVMNRLVLRARVEAESAEAVRRLKGNLEAAGA